MVGRAAAGNICQALPCMYFPTKAPAAGVRAWKASTVRSASVAGARRRQAEEVEAEGERTMAAGCLCYVCVCCVC